MYSDDLENEHTVIDLDVRDQALATPAEESADDSKSAEKLPDHEEDAPLDLHFDLSPTDEEKAAGAAEPAVEHRAEDEALLADLDAFSDDPVSSEPQKQKEEAPRPRPTKTKSRSVKETASAAPSEAPAERVALNPDVVESIGNMPIDVVAVLGRKTLTVAEMARLRAGTLLEIGGSGDRMVDLVANGKTVGQGELVLIEGKLGVRMIKYF